jgi:hypothetical protein
MDMRNLLQPVLTLTFVIFAVPIALLFSAGDSHAQGCLITVEKVAPGAEGQEFQFNGVVEDGAVFAFFVTAGGTASGSASTLPTVITEVPVSGWRFGGIECLPGGGVQILEVLEDGWVEQCVNAQAETFCTVTNVREANIPTLSQWGMISAAAGLVLVGMWFAIRRKRAAVNS